MLRTRDSARTRICCWLIAWSCLTCDWDSIQAQSVPTTTQSAQASSPLSAIHELPNDPIYKSWQGDATLRSICSVTENRLVAVGDRGTILVTSDAGRTWHLVPVPTSVNLSDVHFEGKFGWIVGGWIGTNTGMSYSVVLQSVDGGENWQVLPNVRLPRLVGVRLQGKQILCWGDYSAEHRSSVFSSHDGGMSWQPAVKGTGHVVAADFKADGQTRAIDSLGRVGRHQQDAKIPVQATGNQAVQMKTLLALDAGWLAAGEDGSLVASSDGLTWQKVPMPIDRSVEQLCCWNTLARHDNHVWLAGSPGSVVFHSADRGVSWTAHPTGQTLPIHRLMFVDALRGWAVGAQGTVLATRDGGHTWYAQRKQPARAALLAFAKSSGTTPWGALVGCVWERNQSAVAISLQHAEPIDRADIRATSESISNHVARQIGLSDLWICPVSRDDRESTNEKMAMQLLTWRPDVVLSADAQRDQTTTSEYACDPMAAIQLAADDAFIAKLKSLYLQPWQVQKLASTTHAGSGEYAEQSQRVLRGSGLTVWDILVALPELDRNRNHRIEMRTLWARSQTRANHTELLGGTIPHPETRLTSKLQSLGNYQLVMGRVHRNRMLEHLVRGEGASLANDVWNREFNFFVQSIPPRESLPILIQLADRLLTEGHWQRGRWVLERIATTCTDKDTAHWASLRLLSLTTSQEWLHWIASSQEAETDQSLPAQGRGSNSTIASQVASENLLSPWSYSPFESKVVTASAEVPSNVQPIPELASQVLPNRGFDQFQSVEKLIGQAPSLRFEPCVIMQMASLYRRDGNANAARTMYNELLEQPEIVTWQLAAIQELAILESREASLKWLTRAARATDPPILDGTIEEACWRAASNMELTSFEPSHEPPASLHWAYDEDYLYVGIECPRVSTRNIPALNQQRSYDCDLGDLDRIELSIDTDRDYASTIDLAIAEDGSTNDRCVGLASFNPKWYVQVASQTSRWQAEIAIPLKSIIALPVDSRTSWAISARRIRPNAPPQSWSQLKTHQRLPQGAGLLLFE